MKYLKSFEQIGDDPKIGDYVKVDSSKMKELKDFFDNNIGRIKKIETNELRSGGYPYQVYFDEKIPNSILGPSDSYMSFRSIEFLAWASDLETLKINIVANNYNI